MVATSPTRRWTVEEVYNLPADGNRYEVVHGELLVTPSPLPRHQRVVTRLAHALGTYLEPLGLLDALFNGPVDFFHQTEIYVQPDLVVAVPGEISGDWRTMRHLRLAVEVLSPSSVRGDRLVKRKAYQEARVETYWVADPDQAVVEVWHPGDELAAIVAQTLVLAGHARGAGARDCRSRPVRQPPGTARSVTAVAGSSSFSMRMRI